MFVRIKSTPNSPRKTIQLVEAYRTADGKPRQKIVRYIGVANNDEELQQMKQLAEHIKAGIEEKNAQQLSLISADEIASSRIAAKANSEALPGKVLQKKIEEHKKTSENMQVNLSDFIGEREEITGIHQVYGEVYHEIGFHRLFSVQAVVAKRNLEHIVMSRIARPESKRATVRDLESEFGVEISLPAVYRMMDMIDDEAITSINKTAYSTASRLFGGELRMMFYDCTTLYFESFDEDELREKGFSKDHKTAETQVVLGVLATSEGIPVGYKVFPGSSFEGNTLEKTLDEIKDQYNPSKMVIVADSAMLSQKNQEMLCKKGLSYIVGARIRNLSKKESDAVLDKSSYVSFGKDADMLREVKRSDSERLIVTWKEERARKDAHERDSMLKKLEKKLSKSKAPLSLSSGGGKKYLKNVGESTVEIDEEKIQKDAVWDGLHGVVTNIKEMETSEILGYYAGLWQIEECFRISKHDLKIRPVYHWTPRRIKAHIAICFMALCCVRYLTYRMKLQQEAMSPEEIRRNLMSVKHVILLNRKSEERYVMPMKPQDGAAKIYQAMCLKINMKPYRLPN